MTTAERFWPHVRRPSESECWEWQASLDGRGYGQIMHEGRMWRAHRVAWVMRNGPIPDGLFVLHRCDNRRCVNPGHLFLGTHLDNMRDMAVKGRHAKALPMFRGEGGPKAKLKWPEVRAIRAQLAAGARQADLARLYSVSRSLIHQIASGRIWIDEAA